MYIYISMEEHPAQYFRVTSKRNPREAAKWIYNSEYGNALFNRKYNNANYDVQYFEGKDELSGYNFDFIADYRDSTGLITGNYDGPHRNVYLTFENNPSSDRAFYNRMVAYVNQMFPESASYVGIPFIGKNDYPIYLNISVAELINYETFRERLDQIIDVVNADGYDEIAINTTNETDAFRITFLYGDAYVFGSKPSMTIYDLEDFSGKENCFLNSLRFLGITNDTKDFSLQNYIDILRINNAPVKIVTNSGLVKLDGHGRCVVNEINIIENILYQSSIPYKYKFLYDNEHICKINGFKKLLADCRLKRFTYKVDNKDKGYWTKDNPYFVREYKEDYILAIDFEATYDKFYKTVPYSFSACIMRKSNLQNLVDIDNRGVKYGSDEFNDLQIVNFIYEVGDESYLRTKIVEILREKHRRYKIISFNGCNYDFHILKKMLIEAKISETLFMADSSILCGKIMYVHEILDVRKISGSSLEDCCIAYKIFNKKEKELVSHDEVQSKFNELSTSEFYDWILTNTDNKRYNDLDVLSLLILHGTLCRIFSQTIKKEIDWDSRCTISGIAKEIFDYTVKSKKIHLSGLPEELYYAIKSDCPAGRVQCNTISKESGRFRCPDCCSLYPYVCQLMDNAYFPCGKINETDKYIEGKLGFYFCDIDQSNLPVEKKIYCNKTKIENDWRYNGILLNKCIDTAKIEFLKENGCKVNIIRGWYFDDKIANYELFEEFSEFRKIKDTEDGKPSALRNGALREMMKAMMNCITGKLFQSIHEKTTMSVGLNEWNDGKKISENEREVIVKNKIFKATFLYSLNDKVVVEILNDIEKSLSESRIYLGAFIYSYSQIHMYKHALSKINFDNTDTDSVHMREFEFNKWLEYATTTNVPVWAHMNIIHPLYSENTKIFGSFECELKSYKCGGKCINLIQSTRYLCGKKQYCYINDEGYKLTFKGIGRRDKVINNIILDNKEENEKLYKSDLITVGDDPKSFFEELMNNGKASVVGFQMERNRRDTLKNNAFDIVINYAPKTITLHKLDCKDTEGKCTCYGPF